MHIGVRRRLIPSEPRHEKEITTEQTKPPGAAKRLGAKFFLNLRAVNALAKQIQVLHQRS